MHTMLAPGDTVDLQHHRMTCTVEAFLGSGGQGEVYQVRTDGTEPGRRHALKWYFPRMATADQLAILDELVRQDAPNSRFLWPIDLARSASGDSFGYLMALRGSRYRGIVDLMDRSAQPAFRTIAVTGFQLADGFFELHAAGLCYRDISFGNVFFDPDTGDVLICDNDNVGIDGRSNATVRGTSGFMAPEIMCGEAMPSVATDLYSLSVLMFYLFLIHHPLQGRRELEQPFWDGSAMRLLFGEQPLFIFDEDDRSNEPVAGYHDNALVFWPIYPQFLRDLFMQAFTVGLRDPKNGRVRETVWRMAMVRLYDSIVYCGRCGAENFWDPEASGPLRCWNCASGVEVPPRLVLPDPAFLGGDMTVMLNLGAKLLPHHARIGRLDLGRPPIAEVVRHPSRPDVWGLRNLTGETWVATTPGGTVEEVRPQRSVTLAEGVRLQMGAVEATIRF
jgi:eukaryotic-like serine/threonine-protein kinase